MQRYVVKRDTLDRKGTAARRFCGAVPLLSTPVSYTHLITLASRSHVLGQLFDVLFPYSRKAGLQVRQFFIRQENILVTAIGVGRVPRFRAYLLYLSLYLYLFL